MVWTLEVHNISIRLTLRCIFVIKHMFKVNTVKPYVNMIHNWIMIDHEFNEFWSDWGVFFCIYKRQNPHSLITNSPTFVHCNVVHSSFRHKIGQLSGFHLIWPSDSATDSLWIPMLSWCQNRIEVNDTFTFRQM
jgi:hypothetical protein